MNISNSLDNLLQIETSRRNTNLIAEMVYSNPGLFDELMKIFLKNEGVISRRAGWVVQTVAEKFPEFLLPWLEKLVEELPTFSHDGMKRMSLKMLMNSHLPEKQLGTLIDICFNWLISPKEAVAQKVYAMEILYKVSQAEPDLKKELADSIEWRMEEETPGFRSKGKKILRKINKELRDLHTD